MEKNLAIGVDIGGSHITCAAVDLTSRKVIKETLSERFVDNQSHANVIIGTWTDALAESMEKVPGEKVKGIGFAMPGPFDYVKGICYIRGVAKYENLYGFNIADAVSSSLDVDDDFQVRFMNDVSAFAVGEAVIGKAANTDRSTSVTLGTGFGSAFISKGIPIVDGDEVPKLGCVYHIPYKEGIADDYFSTRGLLRSYKELTGKELPGVRELSEMASSDNSIAGIFREFGKDMGIFLAPYLNTFRAGILVIGGNISYAYSLFGDIFEDTLRQEKCTCKIELSTLKEDAALFGSAYLLDDDFWNAVQHALPLM